MKIIYLILCILLIQLGYAQSNTKDSNITISHKSRVYVLKSSDYTIIPFTQTMLIPFKNVTPTNLEKDEIIAAEKLLVDCIDEYNSKQPRKTSTNGRKYEPLLIQTVYCKRQYIPIINDKGEKEVWINCFRNSFDRDWKKEIISARGGGDGFFNLKVNLAQNKYYDFRVNSLK